MLFSPFKGWALLDLCSWRAFSRVLPKMGQTSTNGLNHDPELGSMNLAGSFPAPQESPQIYIGRQGELGLDDCLGQACRRVPLGKPGWCELDPGSPFGPCSLPTGPWGPSQHQAHSVKANPRGPGPSRLTPPPTSPRG